jgi:hypothetical protein
MLQSKTVTPSAVYHSIADECRTKAQTFRSEKARRQMFKNAAEYERKATASAAYEAAKKDRDDVLWVGNPHGDAD